MVKICNQLLGICNVIRGRLSSNDPDALILFNGLLEYVICNQSDVDTKIKGIVADEIYGLAKNISDVLPNIIASNYPDLVEEGRRFIFYYGQIIIKKTELAQLALYNDLEVIYDLPTQQIIPWACDDKLAYFIVTLRHVKLFLKNLTNRARAIYLTLSIKLVNLKILLRSIIR